jgi:hypothetical protein
MRLGSALLLFGLLVAACETPATIDAGTDAPRAPDVPVPPDAGPPPSGCGRDAGLPPPTWPDAGGPFDPAGHPPARGPGLGAATFTEAELLTVCATMSFGPSDQLHHNTGFFLDGYLVRPYAHEHGGGGVAVIDMSDPCAPAIVANVTDANIRETHATGFSSIGGQFIAVASLTGIQFWDLGDITAPVMLTDMALPGVSYPDAYMRTVMSISWQAPFVYVGASDNGIFVVDALDPRAPRLVAQITPEPNFRVGAVHAVGNLLVAMGSENARVALYDLSVPELPRPYPGGSFLVASGFDRLGRPIPSTNYFGHFSGGRTFHARNGVGSGLAIYDVTEPTAPTWLSSVDAPGSAGGYVFLHEHLAFVGLSNYGLIYDVSDPTMPRDVARIDFPGDLDTMTPFGNMVMVSVDDDAVDGQPTGIFPWRREPDTRGPRVSWVSPADGATGQSIASRVGLTFDELVAMESVWAGSVVVREVASGTVVPGWLSGQEGYVTFWPAAGLRPGTEYEVLVPAGGVRDVSGNRTTAGFRSTFTTEGCGG